MATMGRSMAGMLMTMCTFGMLLICVSAQEPASAPVPSQAPTADPPVEAQAPDTSPPAPPAPSPEVELGGPLKFVANTTVLAVTNDTFTGRSTKVALISPSGVYKLQLVMDGFESLTGRQYCWAEVTNFTGNLTFRENCRPIKVQKCSLFLTDKGDLRLILESNGAVLVSWRTETEGKGVADVKLSDAGELTLVKADGGLVWTSASDKDRCLEPYDPSVNGSPRNLGLSKVIFVCATILILVLSSVL